MTKEIKITKLEIQLTDDTVKLSVVDAQKLYEALTELFGKKTIEHVHHNHLYDYWSYRPYTFYASSWYNQSLGSGPTQTLGNFQGGLQQTNQASMQASNGVAFQTQNETLLCNLAEAQ